jgi:hypothetical protein
MGEFLSVALFAIQLIIAEAGLMLYIASYFGYGLEDVIGYLILAMIVLVLSSVPTTIRDWRFFRQYWDLGLWELRFRFPFQTFPARPNKWLNTLPYLFVAILLLHLPWLKTQITDDGRKLIDTYGVLRYVSLLIFYSGILSALSWKYPPTEKPQG